MYPWCSSLATGKTICLADVKIHGVALPAENLGVDQFSKNKVLWIVKDGLIKVENAPENSKITIYDLTGKQLMKSSDSNNLQAPKTSGIYVGKVESVEGTDTTKFIEP